MTENRNRKPAGHLFATLFFAMFCILSHAQTEYSIQGRITDQAGRPVAYANIALLERSDSSLAGGTITDDEGNFTFRYSMPGRFLLSASFIGYTTVIENIDASSGISVDAGTLIMHEERTSIDEVVIRKRRKKAKQQVEKTTYYVNSRMRSAIQNSTELMNNIPGVRVDLFNNISLNGSSQIVILVNGIQREADYIRQLDAERIDRIEIHSNGGMRYGSGITGVINVILREEKHAGVSGHIHANVPTRSDEVFSFPSASLQVTRNKTTWYTSYNGGFSYFNIRGTKHITANKNERTMEITRDSYLKQENWTHKLHLGMDYFSNEKNNLSLYGFLSGFSNEQDGSFITARKMDEAEPSIVRLKKDDIDRNISGYGSLYYSHQFTPRKEMVLEGSYYMLRSETGTNLSEAGGETRIMSRKEPGKGTLSLRANFINQVSDRIKIETGIQYQDQSMHDNMLPEFRYAEQISAGYIHGAFSINRLRANGGLRLEHSHTIVSDVLENSRYYMIPKINIKFNMKQNSSLNIRYAKMINRPEIHQVNPNLVKPDSYTLQMGNPHLVPEITHNLSSMYSISFEENFLSAGLFYRQEKGIIEDLAILMEDLSLLREKQNLGDLHYAGVKFLGTMNLSDNFSLNPYLEGYHLQSAGSIPAREQGIENQASLGIRGKMSAIWTVKDILSLSASVQFQSPTPGIQHTYREGILYFMNLEKIFFHRLKVGITSAIPFMQSFTYQGHDIIAKNFKETSEDTIKMSMVPVWLKLKYSFASGTKTRRLNRDEVFEEKREGKGF